MYSPSCYLSILYHLRLKTLKYYWLYKIYPDAPNFQGYFDNFGVFWPLERP